jgi:hypothetical protein
MLSTKQPSNYLTKGSTKKVVGGTGVSDLAIQKQHSSPIDPNNDNSNARLTLQNISMCEKAPSVDINDGGRSDARETSFDYNWDDDAKGGASHNQSV